MPFSFNPGQTTAPAAGAAGWQAAPEAPAPVTQATTTLPIIFFQESGKEKSLMAYIQLVLIAVCFTAVLTSASMYAYYFFISKSIASKKLEIEGKEATFKEYPYTEMKKTYDRMVDLDFLLKDYATVRSSFRFLEAIVENKVLFGQFSLQKNESGQLNMSLLARTNDFKTLSQQMGAFGLPQYMKIVPSEHLDNIQEEKESKLGTIKVLINAPVSIQGMLPEDVVTDGTNSSGDGTSTMATTSKQAP